MRSMLSANRKSFVPPSDCYSGMKSSMHHLDLLQENLKKGLETGDTTLANSDSSLKPFKCLIIGHARDHATDGFNYICQFPPMVCFFVTSQSTSIHILSSVFNQKSYGASTLIW